jgi:hypothetical protein
MLGDLRDIQQPIDTSLIKQRVIRLLLEQTPRAGILAEISANGHWLMSWLSFATPTTTTIIWIEKQEALVKLTLLSNASS